MCEVVIVYLYGCDTFIGLLSLARNHNATLAVVDHWDAHLGLHLTEMVLYGTLTFRPNKGTGRTVGIAYSEHPVEAVFLVTGRTQYKEGLRPSCCFTAIFTALSLKCGSLASLNFENILSQNLTILSRIIFSILPNFLYL